MDDIIKHIKKRIGPVHMSFTEIVPGDPPITVHHVKSGLFRPYEVVVTSGMSTRPMKVPEEAKDARFAEVLAILPKGWLRSMERLQDARNYWPIWLLKTLARYPHQNGTWLGYGHTLANGGFEAAGWGAGLFLGGRAAPSERNEVQDRAGRRCADGLVR